jgi:hypothetical protein
MRVTTRAVSILAIESGIPESIVERHIDALITYTFSVAQRERKICKSAIRAWYFSKEIAKPQLFNVLEDIDEDLI